MMAAGGDEVDRAVESVVSSGAIDGANGIAASACTGLFVAKPTQADAVMAIAMAVGLMHEQEYIHALGRFRLAPTLASD